MSFFKHVSAYVIFHFYFFFSSFSFLFFLISSLLFSCGFCRDADWISQRKCHLLSIGVSSGQSASPLFNRLSSVPSVSPPINRLSSVQLSLLRSIASPSYLIFSSPSQREASRHFSRRHVHLCPLSYSPLLNHQEIFL
ncbi:unnamed protein product [Brassica oleracea]